MLSLNNVTKKFKKSVAVKNFSIDCNEQEFLVIFGPAGAGKSTILRLIAGISPLTEGEILLNGESLVDVAPEHRNMAMAFENYALYSHLRVYDNLAFPLKANRNVSKSDIPKKVNAMAEALQITPLLDRRPGFMSGGQRQRVALGRALIRDADVYLLDEPISHLDAKLRHRMRGQLKAICAERDATVVYVTHDYKEAMALSDRIAVINHGKLMQIGTPKDVYHRPANEFVAGFLGDPPMNFIEAELKQENGINQLTIGQTSIALSEVVTAQINEHPTAKGYVKVGIRATDLEISNSQTKNCKVPGEVYVVETFGYRNIVTCQLEGGDLIQSVSDPGLKFEVNQAVWISLAEENIHIFAPTGEAISHPEPRQPVK